MSELSSDKPTVNPWKKVSSELKYDNPWFRVREDIVVRPDGTPGTYSVVSAARLAAGVIPLWPDGTVTLVGQYRYPLSEYSWEIPEGGGPLDGAPETVAAEELREETGITATCFTDLGRIHTSNCFVDEVCHLFVATGLFQGTPQPDPEEVLAHRRVPFADAVAMSCDGRMTDSITIAALFRLLARLDFCVERANHFDPSAHEG